MVNNVSCMHQEADIHQHCNFKILNKYCFFKKMTCLLGDTTNEAFKSGQTALFAQTIKKTN